MVTCRCGCVFENDRWSSHVRCPDCGKIYPNTAPDMFHPISEDELRWICGQCGETNENSYQGCPLTKCIKCGSHRPGNPEEWYGMPAVSSLPFSSMHKKRKRKNR